ncbi:MAG: phosphotransferase [Chloroflexota bacterium]
MEPSAADELRDVLARYDIGELVGCQQLHRGYVNVSYTIETATDGERDTYFFRKYKQGITEPEIEFEHSLIGHLIDEGFDLVAALIPTADGSTYVRRVTAGADGEAEPVFYAIFEFLPGEDRYAWDNPACTDEELRNSAAVFAGYHTAVDGLEPEGKRSEPGICALLPVIAERVEEQLTLVGDTVFDDCLLDHGDLVLQEIERTLAAIRDKGCGQLPQLVIHCDYHPGNLKFQDSQVTGLFDFDWSKIDLRCFDVGLALVYFCTSWEPERNGCFDLRPASVFLGAYQRALAGAAGLGSLSQAELDCLPHMIAAGNLYVLNWALEDFYAKDVDAREYLRYLRHHVGLITWLRDEANWGGLKRMTREAGS